MGRVSIGANMLNLNETVFSSIKHICTETQTSRITWAIHLRLITEIFFVVTTVVIAIIGCIQSLDTEDCLFLIPDRSIMK